MFNFKKVEKENWNYVEKLIDQQGEILKIVEEQRAMIKQLQKTIEEFDKINSKNGV